MVLVSSAVCSNLRFLFASSLSERTRGYVFETHYSLFATGVFSFYAFFGFFRCASRMGFPDFPLDLNFISTIFPNSARIAVDGDLSGECSELPFFRHVLRFCLVVVTSSFLHLLAFFSLSRSRRFPRESGN